MLKIINKPKKYRYVIQIQVDNRIVEYRYETDINSEDEEYIKDMPVHSLAKTLIEQMNGNLINIAKITNYLGFGSLPW